MTVHALFFMFSPRCVSFLNNNTRPAGLDPPFLKDDGSPVTPADAAAVESAEARARGGHVPKGGFAAAVQVGLRLAGP